jgi:hypothetical protein
VLGIRVGGELIVHIIVLHSINKEFDEDLINRKPGEVFEGIEFGEHLSFGLQIIRIPSAFHKLANFIDIV